MLHKSPKYIFNVALYQIMINNSVSAAVWIFNTETELWSLVEAKGDIPVSYLILRIMLWQCFFELTELSSCPELRQLEVDTQWSELVLHWYFLAVRTRRERSGMTYTCLILSHQHGFHWTISKSYQIFAHFFVSTLNTAHLSTSYIFLFVVRFNLCSWVTD